MSILVHKAGINKTLGQKSDYLEGTTSLPRTDTNGWRDSLVGEFLAGSGVSGGGSDIWANSIGGQNDLRVFNSLVLQTSSIPYHAIFDGNDDYIWNTSTGYGGNPFTVNLNADFTIGCWARYTLGSGSSFMFCVQTGTSSGGFLYSSLGSAQFTVSDGNQQGNTSGSASNFLVSSNTWHYLSISHDRSEGKVFLYVDGKYGAFFAPSYSASEGSVRSDGAHWNGSFNLGFGHHLRGNSSNVADSSVECAKLYVWNRYWGASQHRHMFLGQAGDAGIHDLNPHFGPTRTTT
jgi:hypothetical protein